MSRYVSAVKRDIERWVAGGLIDRPTGERLAADVESQERRSFSFGSVLAIMAALLVGAALLLFVGANWELIPRLVRVAMLFIIIAGAYLGGAVAKARGNPGYGEGLYLLGCLAFGGAIALIGQMYHMSGDETQAILVWCLGAALAAGLLRSPVLTNAAIVLAMAWFLMGMEFGPNSSFNWQYAPLAAALWALSYWSGGPSARHLLLLSFIAFAAAAGLYGVERDYFTMTLAGAALAIVSALVFLAAYMAPDEVERFARLGGPYPVHPLIGFLVGVGAIQADVADSFAPMLLTSVVALAGIVAALLMRGRQSRLMRWLAYAAFMVELIFIYVLTIGAMMDTSALFLLFGLALAAAAWLIGRFEKRMLANSGAAS